MQFKLTQITQIQRVECVGSALKGEAMGVYIDGVDMPKGETTELIIRVQPNGEIRDSHGILLKPRAEDIDLVRCGECIHWHEHEWYNTCDKNIGHGYEADFFCAYGEKRNNSKNNSNGI